MRCFNSLLRNKADETAFLFISFYPQAYELLLSIVIKVINSYFQSFPRKSVLQIMEANVQMFFNCKGFERS